MRRHRCARFARPSRDRPASANSRSPGTNGPACGKVRKSAEKNKNGPAVRQTKRTPQPLHRIMSNYHQLSANITSRAPAMVYRPQNADCLPRSSVALAGVPRRSPGVGGWTALRFCTISALFLPHFLACAFHNSLCLNRFRICPSPHGAIPRRFPSHAYVVPFRLVE